MPDLFESFTGLFFVVFLILTNAFFVASEFALVTVKRPRIESLATEGSAAAKRLVGILDDLNAYVSATQLGITLSTLALGWIGQPYVATLLAPLFAAAAQASGMEFLASGITLGVISFIVAFGVITFLHIVFGELVPKTAGLEVSERIAFLVAAPLKFFYRLFYFPIRIMDWVGTRIARVFGLQAYGEHGASYTEDEIRKLIDASEEEGLLNEDERRLLNQVFEFSETTVKEAMIPRTEMVAITMTATLPEIIEIFHEHGYSRLPVYRESLDDILGFIHGKDVLQYIFRPEDFRLDDIMQKPTYVVDTARLEDVLRQMQLDKFHFGFVVDEHGGIEGIITLEDLLEEIVGEISDEHDEEVNEQIHELPDGSYLLDGGLAVRDLNKRLDMHLPVSESYTTVAGFLMAEAGELLTQGDVVPYNGHTFYIEDAANRRIKQVKMERTVPEAVQE